METLEEKVYVGDVGTIFKFIFKDTKTKQVIDLSTASSITIVFEKETGEEIEKTGLLFTDGKDGIAYYAVESGFLDVPGYWRAQGVVTLPGGSWHSTLVRFEVEDVL